MFADVDADDVHVGDRRQWAIATLRHAAPALVEGTLIPLVLFTAIVHTLGMSPALYCSLLWAGLAFGRRLLTGRRMSGILVLTAVGTTLRLATVVWTGSPFIYFLQPVLATVGTALAFGLSVPLRRPLTARLGADLVPIGEEGWAQPEVRRVCGRLSLVWCVALLANAGLTMWMLWNLPVATFVLLRPLVGVVTTLPAIVISFVAGAAVVRKSEGRIQVSGVCAHPVVVAAPVLVAA
jgi:hypothetical protein